MYFKYGSYQHPDNEVCVVTFSRRRVHSHRNRIIKDVYEMHIAGQIIATSTDSDTNQDTIKTRISEIQNAYSDDGEDAGLYHDDGERSGHFLNSLSSVNGVSVMYVEFPKGTEGAQYATSRWFKIGLTAEYLNIESDILVFSETLEFIGTTGPRWTYVPVKGNRPPVRVESYKQTPQRIIQSGMAIGLRGNPLVPPPIFPSLEQQEKRRIRRGSPKSYRNNFLEYPVNWEYHMMSNTGLSGVPGRDL